MEQEQKLRNALSEALLTDGVTAAFVLSGDGERLCGAVSRLPLSDSYLVSMGHSVLSCLQSLERTGMVPEAVSMVCRSSLLFVKRLHEGVLILIMAVSEDTEAHLLKRAATAVVPSVEAALRESSSVFTRSRAEVISFAASLTGTQPRRRTALASGQGYAPLVGV